MKAIILFVCLVLTSVLSSSAQSPTTGGIRVTVKDANGSVITLANVVVKSAGGREWSGVTRDDGSVTFKGLEPGTYRARVSADGFSAAESTIAVADSLVDRAVDLEVGERRFAVTAEVGRSEDTVNIPQAINVMGQVEMKNRVVEQVIQVAEEEVGINVQRTSPTIGAIVVRGLTGKNVVNFIDGVRYTNSAQRGGINTFFNLNDAAHFQTIEVLRGPNSAQYGSDSLGGTVNLITRLPNLGMETPEWHGEFVPTFNSSDRSFGSSGFLTYGMRKVGVLGSFAARRVNDLRTADGIDSHSAITRFLGLPSSILYDRNPETGYTQYSGAVRVNYAPTDDHQLAFFYQRSQQDDGKRFDQLLGGDGNLIADLRNLMLDFGYVRLTTSAIPLFDSGAFSLSYNSQREERVNQGGQGNPVGDITHQYERTSVAGFNFHLDRQLPGGHSFLFGGDAYHEKINAPAYISSASNVVTLSRPRVPDEARFDAAGLFIQDAWEAIPDRLRVTGALRYGGAIYKARAADAPVIGGLPLWRDDSLRAADLSGRIGAVVRIVGGLRAAFNYSHGFRYPAMTDLGTLGLTGDGFEVDYLASSSLGGTIGNSALSSAISTGKPVSKQKSEISDNFDFSLRYHNRRFDAEFTAYRLDIRDAITKQALILPAGAVGRFLADRQIVSQLPNGTVFVSGVATPVLVRANYTTAQLYGVEFDGLARLKNTLWLRGNFTYNHAADKDTGLAPNIEGGTPPPTGFLSLRYGKSRFWIEAYTTIAAKQDRLSSLDLGDRRTGAARSRAQIQNYFRRGACVNGVTTPGPSGCGSAGGILIQTGETQAQVQNRLLPIGATINGVTVVNDNTAVPLFTYLPSYATANLRGGFRVNENVELYAAFKNITDSFYRNASWGIDGPGRSVTLQMRYQF